jgi:hypothetical protein
MNKETKESVFEEYERVLLKKYKEPRRMDIRDEEVLNRLSLIGLIEHHFNFSEMYPIVSLTPLCKKLLE